ncbi:MAG: dihydrofolate reductase family protein [Desulfobacterales bacterium]
MKVILLMALTLDGRTGKGDNHFVDWSGSEDKKLFVEVTRKAGALIMGSKTFDTIGKPLPGRCNIVMTRMPENRRSDPPNLIFTAQSPESILLDLSKSGYREVVLAGGTVINTIFARQGLIDEILVTYSPLIFGKGLSLFTEEIAMELNLLETERLGQELIMARYQVKS